MAGNSSLVTIRWVERCVISAQDAHAARAARVAGAQDGGRQSTLHASVKRGTTYPSSAPLTRVPFAGARGRRGDCCNSRPRMGRRCGRSAWSALGNSVASTPSSVLDLRCCCVRCDVSAGLSSWMIAARASWEVMCPTWDKDRSSRRRSRTLVRQNWILAPRPLFLCQWQM